MPELSMFTPCCMLELSSMPSYGETIYTSLVGALRPAFDMTPGTYMECWVYATSMMLARAKYAIDRAGNQQYGLTAWDLIPLLEQGYLLVPSPNDGIPTRQAAIAVAQALSRGARQENLVAGVRGLLGAALLAIVPTSQLTKSGTPVDPMVVPSNPIAGFGKWSDPRVSGKWLQLIDPVIQTGTPSWCAYQSLDTTLIVTNAWQGSTTYPQNAKVIPTSLNATGFWYSATTGGLGGTSEPVWGTVPGQTTQDGQIVWTCMATTSPTLLVGEQVVVQGENTSQAELVTVTAVSLSAPPGGNTTPGLTFQATFTKAHDVGATLTTGPFPYWWSTRRQLFAIVTTATAANRDARRRVDEFLGKASRGVDLWAMVQPSTLTTLGGTIGPLQVASPMGCATVGALGFTNTP